MQLRPPKDLAGRMLWSCRLYGIIAMINLALSLYYLWGALHDGSLFHWVMTIINLVLTVGCAGVCAAFFRLWVRLHEQD